MNRPFVPRPNPAALFRARELAASFRARAAALDLSGDFPAENIADLHEAGLLGLTMAKSAGGESASLALARQVVSTIATGDPSTALIVSMHYINHASIRLQDRWPATVAERLTRDNRQRPALINALQVEPEAGSPSYGTLPQTTARNEAGEWRITGRKRFSTGCEGLAWMIVSAVTDEDAPRIGSFVIAADSPGVSIIRTWDVLGMRATGSHDVVFDNVAVAETDTLDLAPVSEGIKRDPRMGAWFMLLIGSVYHGIALAARDDAVAFASHFRPGNLPDPLIKLPKIQDDIGQITILLSANERLLSSTAADADSGHITLEEAASVRLLVIENAIKAVEVVLAVAGNAGISRQYPFERHFRNVICGRTHAPHPPVIRANAAKAALNEFTLPG